MPSNNELIQKAEALAKDLGIEVDTDGLKNPDLEELCSDLQAKKQDAELQTRADQAPAQGKKKPPFYVAPRKSITSKRGILTGDNEDEVQAEDLTGGQDALKKFVASGHVLRGG